MSNTKGKNGLNLDDENTNELEKIEKFTLPRSKYILVKKILSNIRDNADQLLQVLGSNDHDDEGRISIGQSSDDSFINDQLNDSGIKIIEGVFDGENMIGPDGKIYSVPANYASKSKLIEGDIMKLAITEKGTFVYKQIGPIDRIRVVGKLEKGMDGNFFVMFNGHKWRVLTASVTYFKGNIEDEVVILIPKTGESKWAAIENIVHN